MLIKSRAERMSTMAKRITAEEREILLKSPHVEKVSSSNISFTPEFKREIYQEMLNGKTVREILFEHGINPDMLGNGRVWGLASTLKKNADREEGFKDLRDQNQWRPASPEKDREQSLEAKIKQLEHELAYTRQEVEFLKKIRMADLEAQKEWESKQRQK